MADLAHFPKFWEIVNHGRPQTSRHGLKLKSERLRGSKKGCIPGSLIAWERSLTSTNIATRLCNFSVSSLNVCNFSFSSKQSKASAALKQLSEAGIALVSMISSNGIVWTSTEQRGLLWRSGHEGMCVARMDTHIVKAEKKRWLPCTQCLYHISTKHCCSRCDLLLSMPWNSWSLPFLPIQEQLHTLKAFGDSGGKYFDGLNSTQLFTYSLRLVLQCRKITLQCLSIIQYFMQGVNREIFGSKTEPCKN